VHANGLIILYYATLQDYSMYWKRIQLKEYGFNCSNCLIILFIHYIPLKAHWLICTSLFFNIGAFVSSLYYFGTLHNVFFISYVGYNNFKDQRKKEVTCITNTKVHKTI